jgi:hypothetical protein
VTGQACLAAHLHSCLIVVSYVPSWTNDAQRGGVVCCSAGGPRHPRPLLASIQSSLVSRFAVVTTTPETVAMSFLLRTQLHWPVQLAKPCVVGLAVAPFGRRMAPALGGNPPCDHPGGWVQGTCTVWRCGSISPTLACLAG